MPAVVAGAPDGPPRWPCRFVLRCELDAGGRIAEIHSILAARKLTAVRFPADA